MTIPFCIHSENGTRRCRDCDRRYQAEYRSRPGMAERDRKRKRVYTEANRPQRRLISYRHQLRKYGIELEEALALYDRQSGRCGVCRDELPRPPSHGVHLDHCHETGRVRGYLCRGCNLGLGNFLDSAERLSLAIDYLKGD